MRMSYILHNPVRANLATTAEDWPHRWMRWQAGDEPGNSREA